MTDLESAAREVVRAYLANDMKGWMGATADLAAELDGRLPPSDLRLIRTTDPRYLRSRLALGAHRILVSYVRNGRFRCRRAVPVTATDRVERAARMALRHLQAMDAQAASSDYLVAITVKSWKDNVRPTIVELRQALAALDAEKETP